MTLVLCLICFMLFPLILQAEEVVVIVNTSNNIENIGKKKLKKIYMGKMKTWKDGEAIKPVDTDIKDPARKIFSKNIMKKKPRAVERLYLKKALSGKSQPPKKIKSYESIIEWVKNNKGAIAYVPKSVSPKGVKVIKIGGAESMSVIDFIPAYYYVGNHSTFLPFSKILFFNIKGVIL